jgi:hypothetical protein
MQVQANGTSKQGLQNAEGAYTPSFIPNAATIVPLPTYAARRNADLVQQDILILPNRSQKSKPCKIFHF